MTPASVPVIDRTQQLTNVWLNGLAAEVHLSGPEQALSVLRAVLHAVRELPDEAVDLGAQLPTLIRGFVCEQWKPSATPRRRITAGEVEDVRHVLPGPIQALWPQP